VAEFGITQEGFVLKPFGTILEESMARARAMFGDDVDLKETSAIRKLLEVSAAEDAALWQRLEELYYSNFASTAVGDELELIGENVGLERRNLFASGRVTLQVVSPPQADRRFLLPEATVLVTTSTPDPLTFHTTEPVTLVGTTPTVGVSVQAFARGALSGLAPGQTFRIDPVYAQLNLEMRTPTTVTGTNPERFQGGAGEESDADFRARILGLPRNMWTLESIRSAALEVEGVTDVALSDPLGGVDVSQSYFNLFNFNERVFSGERRLGEPYFFDVVVAHEFAYPWETETIPPLVSPVVGIFEGVSAAVDRVRPVGIHPNVVEANHIEVGVRAQVIVEPGFDQQALFAAIKDRLLADIGALKLGGDVLYSQVMRAFVEQPGVIDVQQMRLRRCPPQFGRITFGEVPFQTEVVEALPGENLVMGSHEVAIFRLDSELVDVKVVPR
jgi:hypothetical protein